MTDASDSNGLVILAGAGPGDPMLTAPATTYWLKKADTVVYDRLANPALLACCKPEAELIFAGKSPQGHTLSQDEINNLLVNQACQGKLVVRLKGGDPFVFGRGGEEVQALNNAGLPYRIVPGITAAIAAGAYSGIPLTDRRCASTVTFITGHEDPDKAESTIDYSALARLDTLVFYMGIGNLASICQRLIQSGRAADTPAAVIERASQPTQRTITATLDTLAKQAAEAHATPPALVVVGKVVSLGQELSWLENLPLFGQTVLVTRSRPQASQLAASLAELGANVIEAPTIEIAPVEDFSQMDQALQELGQFDWLVLTSPNGVTALLNRCRELGLDARSLAKVRIAAIGPGTATTLKDAFLSADLVPETFTTEALGQALVAQDVSGKRILLARADIAEQALAETLRQAGAQVHDVTFYRTVRPAALPAQAVEALTRQSVNWITFTSSSTVENFLQLLDNNVDLSGIKLAAIGPITAETLSKSGLQATIEANPHTIDALTRAIAEFRR